MGEVKPIDATEAKPGRYVIFDGYACVVKSLEISRPGKHGHAKCRIQAVAIKDGRKIIKIMPGHDKIESPVIEKKSAQVLSVMGDRANVMDNDSFETFDIIVPEELKEKVKEGVQVTYWVVLDEKIVQDVMSSG
ncbi:translation initiation factor IF-5A [Candidatus Woesearchaeota archaeon]|nr:translation initiation factor IF-5A [Candidatus Woesearchaeota archaeon]